MYFTIGTYFANKFYPVQYKFKTFISSLVIYSLYACFATYTDNQIISFAAGIFVFLIHLIINRKVIKALFDTAMDVFIKLRKKQ